MKNPFRRWADQPANVPSNEDYRKLPERIREMDRRRAERDQNDQ